MLIVLGGTRKVDKIPQEVSALVTSFAEQGHRFLVGDAPGIDTGFQKLLIKLMMKDVIVCSSADSIRNNLGNWSEKHIDSGLKSNSHAKHSAKDRYMTNEADLGIMVWDTLSAGTLANVLDLISLGKECYLFNLMDSDLTKFDSDKSLNKFLDSHQKVANESQKRLATYRKRLTKRETGAKNTEPPSLFS